MTLCNLKKWHPRVPIWHAIIKFKISKLKRRVGFVIQSFFVSVLEKIETFLKSTNLNKKLHTVTNYIKFYTPPFCDTDHAYQQQTVRFCFHLSK